MILIWIQGCGYSDAGTELHDITTHIIKIALFFNAYFYSKNIISHIFHAIERTLWNFESTRKTQNPYQPAP